MRRGICAAGRHADGWAFQSVYQRLELLLHEAEDIYIETADVIDLEQERRR